MASAQTSPVAEVAFEEAEVGWANVLQAAATFAVAWLIAVLTLHRCSKVVSWFASRSVCAAASSSASAAEEAKQQARVRLGALRNWNDAGQLEVGLAAAKEAGLGAEEPLVGEIAERRRLLLTQVFEIKTDRCGKGSYTGTTHNGQKDGKLHGKGRMTWEDGGVYDGEWHHDRVNGDGTLTYFWGDKYVGQWKDGLRHGQGTLTGYSRSKYEGQWKEGRRDGEGTFIGRDGNKFVGQWKDDRRHGRGVFTSKSGKEYSGPWQKDKMEFCGKMTDCLDLP